MQTTFSLIIIAIIVMYAVIIIKILHRIEDLLLLNCS